MATDERDRIGTSARRRHAADVEAEFFGKPQPHGSFRGDDPPGSHLDVGYLGPEAGPFRCGNCIFFRGGSDETAPGVCTNPQVRLDPGVRGRVKAGGCCHEFARSRDWTGDNDNVALQPPATR